MPVMPKQKNITLNGLRAMWSEVIEEQRKMDSPLWPVLDKHSAEWAFGWLVLQHDHALAQVAMSLVGKQFLVERQFFIGRFECSSRREMQHTMRRRGFVAMRMMVIEAEYRGMFSAEIVAELKGHERRIGGI